MSSHESDAQQTGSEPDDQSGIESARQDPVELRAQLDVLSEENDRLREEYARAKRSQYYRSALGLVGIGMVAVVGGILFPSVRPLLFVLGATGLFAGLLTYFLTPERFITADVGQSVFTAAADDIESILGELGLQERQVYVPITDERGERTCRLFVPQHENYRVPESAALQSTFVTTADSETRGVAFTPTGQRLFREFERTLRGGVSRNPSQLAAQLADGLVEQLELCEQVTPDVDTDTGRATFGVVGSTFGPLDRINNPIASFLGVGIARGVDSQVELSVEAPDDARSDYLVTVRWASANGEPETEDRRDGDRPSSSR